MIFYGGPRAYLCIVLPFVRRCTEKSGDRNFELAPLGCLALTDEVKFSPHYSISRPQVGFGGCVTVQLLCPYNFFSSIIKDHQGRILIGSNEPSWFVYIDAHSLGSWQKPIPAFTLIKKHMIRAEIPKQLQA